MPESADVTCWGFFQNCVFVSTSLFRLWKVKHFAFEEDFINHSEKSPSEIPDVPVGNYMFKVKNRNARTRCEISSKLTIKTPERPQWHRSGVVIVNFEHISHPFLPFLILTLSR